MNVGIPSSTVGLLFIVSDLHTVIHKYLVCATAILLYKSSRLEH